MEIVIIGAIAVALFLTAQHTEHLRKTATHYNGVNDAIEMLSIIGLIQLGMLVICLFMDAGWDANIQKIIHASWGMLIVGGICFYGLSFLCVAVVGCVIAMIIDP